MNKDILVSVITVAFNEEKGIERTIKSVLNQTYKNIEFIVIDGGSKDGTVDIIKRYQNHIDYWVSEPDGGIYFGMNKGIEKAHGEFLIFLNGGDWFCSDDIVQKIMSHYTGKEMMLYGNVIQVHKHHKRRLTGVTNTNPDLVDLIPTSMQHQGSFISKHLFEKYGYYDTNYRLASDHKFNFEVVGIHKEPVKYINLDVAYFSMDGASSTSKDKYMAELEDIFKNAFGIYYPYMDELYQYRKSTILRNLHNFRTWMSQKGILRVIRNVLIRIKSIFLR